MKHFTICPTCNLVGTIETDDEGMIKTISDNIYIIPIQDDKDVPLPVPDDYKTVYHPVPACKKCHRLVF
jgi:hypothetical protein